MKNLGLFKQYKEYYHEASLQKKQVLLQDICEQYRRKRNAPDCDGDFILAELSKEYEKGMKRHLIAMHDKKGI